MKSNNNENFEVQNLETLKNAVSQILSVDLTNSDRAAVVALMVENDITEQVLSIIQGSNVYTKEVQGSLYQ